ncbi:creatininase family protein [Oryzibacter oryziterrae]|uniref:creatininase family protein n=1 Tax=Oryzibacter oryziterrae TaxID=2766474 RepID=UPI001F162D85|nr:creatininase family protein [Oryzibacter oryziterrae]
MTDRFYWNELTSPEFAALDPETTIAILPLASTEQHGPHLPVATDVAIANGLLGEVRKILPDHFKVLVLPTQEIGKANEHVFGPGTLSLPAELLIQMWTTIGQKVSEAGLRKMIIVNSHGGNLDLMSIVAREMRVRFQMAVVSTQWSRFGSPDGLFSAHEMAYGIHGGDVETSMMLYLRPDLVRMDKAENFVSKAEWMRANTKYLQPLPPHSLAWIAHDLNPAGVVGDASNANAEKGRLYCEHVARGFIDLIADLTGYPLSNLYKG